MNINYIIQPVIGGVIGYFTNWLAIKMLFRPYTEKKIGNFRIPFTPGMIPKEKGRLAKSIGTTIGEHILTDEMMIEALTDKNIKNELERMLDNFYTELNTKDITVEQYMEDILQDEKNNFIQKIQQKIYDIIHSKMQDNYLQEKIARFANEKLISYMSMPMYKLYQTSIYKGTKELLIKALEGQVKEDKFKQSIHDIIIKYYNNLSESEKSINQIIPSDILEQLKNILYNYSEPLVNGIENFIENEETQRKLKQHITLFIYNNFGKLAGIFVNVNVIYDSLIKEIKDYLREEENQKQIIKYIINYVEKLEEKSLREILDEIPGTTKENILEKLEDNILKLINENLAEKASEYIELKLKEKENLTILEFIKQIDKNVETKLETQVKHIITTFINAESTKSLVSNLISNAMQNILAKRLQELVSKLGFEYFEVLKQALFNKYDILVKKEAPKLVKALNIPNMIEKRMNEFDVKETEKIIIEVVDKELFAITWLGGVLGVIIGLIPIILNYFS